MAIWTLITCNISFFATVTFEKHINFFESYIIIRKTIYKNFTSKNMNH